MACAHFDGVDGALVFEGALVLSEPGVVELASGVVRFPTCQDLPVGVVGAGNALLGAGVVGGGGDVAVDVGVAPDVTD